MGIAAPTVDEFFDTEFLTALQGFSLWARRIISGGRHAEQLSRDKGAGLEFADYKAYVPGDDTRTIDWNIYRRLGRVVVKVFEERQELPVYLLVDRSGSMYFEAAPKIGVALKVALALASISLSQHDSVGLFSFSENLEMKLKNGSGQGRLMRVAERLAQLEEQGGTELVQAIEGVERLRLRRGLLIVISDFYDPAGLDAVLGSLAPDPAPPVAGAADRQPRPRSRPAAPICAATSGCAIASPAMPLTCRLRPPFSPVTAPS